MFGAPHYSVVDGDMTDSASRRVVREVAEATDSDPSDLPPLYEVVDPDALDGLFRPRTAASETTDTGVAGSGPVVRFSYAGREVSVRRDGVTVRE